ncbi:4Fe-4S binding protein [bacterium]|nr:4Fe-4S binding protein [bacterium]MBU1025880.1 4Fe-4S binding protein [bacterium]
MRRIFTNHELCTGCRACTMACAISHFGIANESLGAIRILRNPFLEYEFQALCRICDEPECVAACMAVALTRDPETGQIKYIRERCVGCWMCVSVCPHQAVVQDEKAGKAILCDQCDGRDKPACVASCATKAIAFTE